MKRVVLFLVLTLFALGCSAETHELAPLGQAECDALEGWVDVGARSLSVRLEFGSTSNEGREAVEAFREAWIRLDSSVLPGDLADASNTVFNGGSLIDAAGAPTPELVAAVSLAGEYLTGVCGRDGSGLAFVFDFWEDSAA